MKGISDIIAMLLMLVITIAIAGLAYGFITGIFTSRTAVILTFTSTQCSGSTIYAYVRNDGTTAASSVVVNTANNPGEAASKQCDGPASISPGTEANYTCTKAGGAGYYALRVSATGTSATGSVYCSS
jgi:flagellin-like protein